MVTARQELLCSRQGNITEDSQTLNFELFTQATETAFYDCNELQIQMSLSLSSVASLFLVHNKRQRQLTASIQPAGKPGLSIKDQEKSLSSDMEMQCQLVFVLQPPFATLIGSCAVFKAEPSLEIDFILFMTSRDSPCHASLCADGHIVTEKNATSLIDGNLRLRWKKTH